jgi:cyanate permease
MLTMTQERTNLIAVIVIWLALLVAVLFIDTPSTRWWMVVIGAALTGVVLIRMVLDRRRSSQGSVN